MIILHNICHILRTMNRKSVSKILNKEVANQIAKLDHYDKKTEMIMECLKPGMVEHLLKKSTAYNLEKDCRVLAADTVIGLSTSMSLACKTCVTKIEPQVPQNEDHKQ